MHHSPCAVHLPASRAPCCVPQVLLVLLYEPCSTTRDESCNDVNDEPCADPAPSQNDLLPISPASGELREGASLGKAGEGYGPDPTFLFVFECY